MSPYPLPSGDLGDDDIVCQLVYLPDRPEYWQAFLGALSYMSTWRAWERDDDKRGKDAAANWREAFELTMECWRMACLQDLQDDVAEILEVLKLGSACCDETDVSSGDQFTDRVEDGVGNVPQNIIDAGYASGSSDWAGFDDYKCMICHVTVDTMQARLLEMAPYVNDLGIALGGVATLAAIVTAVLTLGGAVLVLGIVASTGTAALLYSVLFSGGLLETLAAKVATNHDWLVCAMYDSDGDDDSLDSLNDKIDELFTAPEALILKNLNLGPTIKALYAGRYDQQDIAEILDDAGYELESFDCECEQIGEFFEWWDFNDGTPQGFLGNFTLTTNCYAGSHGLYVAHDTYAYLSSTLIMGRAGASPSIGDKLFINRTAFWYKVQSGWPNTKPRILIDHDGGQFSHQLTNETVWTYHEHEFDPPLEITHFEQWVWRMYPVSGGGGVVFFDEILIDYDCIWY